MVEKARGFSFVKTLGKNTLFSLYFCLSLEEKIRWLANARNPQISGALMELAKARPKKGCWLSCEGEDIISIEEVNRNFWLLINDPASRGPEVPNI